MTPKETVEYVARALVDRPDAVQVKEVQAGESLVLELRVAPGDMGKVIGRGGQVVNALRTLLAVSAAREGRRVSLEVIGPEGPGVGPPRGDRGPRR